MAVAGDLRDAGTSVVQDAACIEATGEKRGKHQEGDRHHEQPTVAYIATGNAR